MPDSTTNKAYIETDVSLLTALEQCPEEDEEHIRNRAIIWERLYADYVMLPDGRLKIWNDMVNALWNQRSPVFVHCLSKGIVRLVIRGGYNGIIRYGPTVYLDFGTPLTEAQITTLLSQVPEMNRSMHALPLHTLICPRLPIFNYQLFSDFNIKNQQFAGSNKDGRLTSRWRILLEEGNNTMQQLIQWTNMTGDQAWEHFETIADNLSAERKQDAILCRDPNSSSNALRKVAHSFFMTKENKGHRLPTSSDEGGQALVLLLLASNPNTSPEILELLAAYYPVAVATNPIASLLCLENPGWGEAVSGQKGIIRYSLSRWSVWAHLPDMCRPFYRQLGNDT